jgi:plasmid replication initiation protein
MTTSNGLYSTIIEQWGPPGVMVVLLVVAIYYLYKWQERSREDAIARFEKSRVEDLIRFENDRKEIREAHKDEREAWRATDQERHNSLSDLVQQQITQNGVTGEALIKLTATLGELRGIVASSTGQRYQK